MRSAAASRRKRRAARASAAGFVSDEVIAGVAVAAVVVVVAFLGLHTDISAGHLVAFLLVTVTVVPEVAGHHDVEATVVGAILFELKAVPALR